MGNHQTRQNNKAALVCTWMALVLIGANAPAQTTNSEPVRSSDEQAGVTNTTQVFSPATNAPASDMVGGPTNGVSQAGLSSTNAPGTGTNTLTPALSAKAKPEPALASFRVKRGFVLQTAASEPQVASPSAMAFDEHGRLYVAEMRDYPDGISARPRLGSIRLLEDPDDTGVFTTNYVFAQDLGLPAGIVCYDGGIFVAATPEILYLKDTDGDHRADLRRVVFSGFIRPPQATPDQYINSLAWGPDNRIHGLSAGLDGNISGSALPQPLALAGADFSFDPRTLDLRRETGNGRSGLAFDNFGRKFVSDLSRPVRQPVLPRHYLDRNPFLDYGTTVHDVALPAVAIYRATENTNTISAGWLRNANGLTIYRGNAFPTNYLGNVFVPDREAGVIHRELVRDYGLEFYAERAADEMTSEFLSSRDPQFHPTQIVNGPDGCFYIADFREGKDTGRIYRLAPEGYRRPARIHFAKLGEFELAGLLGHANGWHRDTAARLLMERKSPAAAGLVSGMVGRARSELTRFHALSVLAGLGPLAETNLLAGLRDRSPVIREQSLRLAETTITNGVMPDGIWNQVRTMASDSSLRVRFQLAFTAGQVRRADRIGVLATIVRRDPSGWVATAALSSVNQGASLLFGSLASDTAFRSSAAGQVLLSRLASQIGVGGQADQVNPVIDFIAARRLDEISSYAFLRSMGDGLNRTRSSLALVDEQNRLRPLFRRLQVVLLDDSLDQGLRWEALQLAGVGALIYQDVGDLLLLQLGSGQPYEIQAAAVAALGRFNDPRVTTNLFSRWGTLSPAVRVQAVSALLSRGERVPLVMTALRDRIISPADFSPVRIHFLRTHRNTAVSQEAIRVFGIYNPNPENVQRYSGALKLTPNPGRGRQIFLERCADCHRLNGAGRDVGPDLAGLKIMGKEALLQAIAEPNMNIRQGYAAVVIENLVGENAIGILEHESPQAVTLAQPGGGRVIWGRPNIQLVQPQPWSIMPEGLLNGLSQQQVADLLGAIMSLPR
jgi:putative membrane-bound dehydrogenase-like protein